MKLLYAIVLLCYTFTVLEANTDKEIKNKVSALSSKSRQEKSLNKKFKSLASQILTQMKNLEILKKKINTLDKSISIGQKDIKTKKSTLSKLLNNNKELLQEKKALEAKLIRIIAKDFSYYLISDKDYVETQNSILIDEIIKKMNVIMKKEFAQLAKNYEKINKNIASHQNKIKKLRADISDLKSKKQELIRLIARRESAIKSLASEKKRYKKRLVRLDKEKQSIRATLERLKILKKQEISRARRQKRLTKNQKTLKVRQIGSSYQSANVRRYRGRKTIAPLDSFVIKRKFGNYIDPIYKIKIFNESIVMESNIRNAKVKNVLNGKVVFARDTAVLDKVVIVENSHGIHTIYAHLSQIAPTIRVGKKILKGYIIGRVKDELTFEVTQKNYHINPLDLIALKH
ncbi:murein hydrolase activator EnvC family protein [Sulfurospirillum sp. 1612]|uniref:murein hydrolase activator EnvC family protein n=1 Tax=Sulfurospirillum sp. 1612 TaxID=3094835 RepID=UPI002F95F58F